MDVDSNCSEAELEEYRMPMEITGMRGRQPLLALSERTSLRASPLTMDGGSDTGSKETGGLSERQDAIMISFPPQRKRALQRLYNARSRLFGRSRPLSVSPLTVSDTGSKGSGDLRGHLYMGQDVQGQEGIDGNGDKDRPTGSMGVGIQRLEVTVSQSKNTSGYSSSKLSVLMTIVSNHHSSYTFMTSSLPIFAAHLIIHPCFPQ